MSSSSGFDSQSFFVSFHGIQSVRRRHQKHKHETLIEVRYEVDRRERDERDDKVGRSRGIVDIYRRFRRRLRRRILDFGILVFGTHD